MKCKYSSVLNFESINFPVIILVLCSDVMNAFPAIELSLNKHTF